MPDKRDHRPTDIIKRPETPNLPAGPASTKLPDSWQTVLDEADTWPFPDPDETFSTPEEDYTEWEGRHTPSDEIVPFSEFEPWGKMEGETDAAYEKFLYFRSLGLARKKTDVAKHYGITRESVDIMARKNDWNDRVAAWDDYRERLYTAELLQGVKEMAVTHAGVASKGIEALSSAFDALLGRMHENPEQWQEELNSLPAKQLFAIVQRSAQVIPNLMNAERLSRGLPTEISANLNLNETRVTIQSRDDLAEIVAGLAGVIGHDDIEEADVIDVRERDPETPEEPDTAA